MSTLTISAGKHYDNRIFSSGLHSGIKVMKRFVRFHENCSYEFEDYYQGNVNKLFGFQSGLKIWKDKEGQWDFGIHCNSARFGWRWSKADKCIELLAYCYNEGVRNWNDQKLFPVVAQIALGVEAECAITVTDTQYLFTVKTNKGGLGLTEEIAVPHGKLANYGITNSLYFGGSLPAPHEMTIDMNESAS